MADKAARRVHHEMTDEVRVEIRALITNARYAALACIDPEDGHPLVSRVGLATFADGTPFIFISALAAHTAALLADARCALLVGEPGKGDALAYPRLSLKCMAEVLGLDSPQATEARQRYLAAHPKAKLYIDLPDFRFFRLNITNGSFNGGFGRAYIFEAADLLAS